MTGSGGKKRETDSQAAKQKASYQDREDHRDWYGKEPTGLQNAVVSLVHCSPLADHLVATVCACIRSTRGARVPGGVRLKSSDSGDSLVPVADQLIRRWQFLLNEKAAR